MGSARLLDMEWLLCLLVIAGWGSHHSDYPVAYLTAAACVGMTHLEVETFIARLDKCLMDWKKKLVIDVTIPPILNGSSVANASDTNGDVASERGKVSDPVTARICDQLSTDFAGSWL